MYFRKFLRWTSKLAINSMGSAKNGLKVFEEAISTTSNPRLLFTDICWNGFRTLKVIKQCW